MFRNFGGLVLWCSGKGERLGKVRGAASTLGCDFLSFS